MDSGTLGKFIDNGLLIIGVVLVATFLTAILLEGIYLIVINIKNALKGGNHDEKV